MSLSGFSVLVRFLPFTKFVEPVTDQDTETKNKTLEELDIYFGGTADSIAQADRARMQRINASLGIANAENVEDLRERATSFSAEKTKGADDA